MRFVMVTLSAICGMLALGAPFVVVLLEPTISVLARLEPVQVGMPVEKTMGLGLTVIEVVLGVLVIAAALLLLRRILLAGRDVRQEVTWDCGYARPTARMQYTGSSFARPLTSMFGGFLRTRTKVGTPEGVFPRHSAMESHPTDLFRDGVFAPLFRGGARALARLRWLQHGRLHLYVLYIALTLLALLVWQLGVRQ
jgi:hydrogenase-4 component B